MVENVVDVRASSWEDVDALQVVGCLLEASVHSLTVDHEDFAGETVLVEVTFEGLCLGVFKLELKDAKTQALKGHFDKHGFTGKVLVIDGETVDAGFKQAANNLKGVNVLPAAGANVYDILNHDTLVLTKDAVAKLEARFNG